jgi:DNA topoisomerase-1
MNDPAENAAAAKAAGLRYVTDTMPGISRRRRGRGFAYVDPKGTQVRDDATLTRIRSLAVPPAYHDVWICPLPNGHIQATGRDDRDRKQYRYHPRWREVRDETKYERLLDFARALPAIRKRIATDLRARTPTREKILATIVRLLETTTIRVGNDEYARTNNSFGLTTLRNGHAKVHGAVVTFSFRGKSGIKHAIDLRDEALAKVVRQCQDLPGQQLFEYIDENSETHAIDSNDVNDYLREISGGDFTAKDFRTWVGTVQCALVLAESEPGTTQAERKTRLNDAIKIVASRLGNTPAVCRKCYVHPEILAAYLEDGTIGAIGSGKRAKGLLPAERFVVAFLKRRAKQTPAQRTSEKLRRSLRNRG